MSELSSSILNALATWADGPMRLVVAAIWAAVVVFCAGAIWRTLIVCRPRYYDRLAGLLIGTGMLMIGYQLRWLFASDDKLALFGLEVFSIILAGLKLWTLRQYQADRDD